MERSVALKTGCVQILRGRNTVARLLLQPRSRLRVMIDAGMELIRDLRDLSKQLQDFSVDRAECFCCSNKHIHPTTGQALPCDRELVVETLGGVVGIPNGSGNIVQIVSICFESRRLFPCLSHRGGAEVVPGQSCVDRARHSEQTPFVSFRVLLGKPFRL